MENQSRIIFLNLSFIMLVLLFTMAGSIHILGQTYRRTNKKIALNAQTVVPSPTPTKTPTPTPTPSSTPTPLPTSTLTPTPTVTTSPTNTSAPASQTPTPTNTTSPTTVQSVQATNSSKPFDITNWKLTLPIGESEKPTEILQPELANFAIDPWFAVVSGALRFRAAVNGVTTGGSSYPRSELREMTDGGKNRASWSSKSGKHTMFVDEAITAVPQVKKHVVAAQIHDSNDDVIVIRLELPNLYINVDGKNKYTLDSDYTLGERFNVRFEVSEGKTKVFYNGGSDPVFTLDKGYSGAYFKAGAYTQSNCSKEGSSGPCSDSNFGEVFIYQLAVTHE